jgi:hypothetical protein
LAIKWREDLKGRMALGENAVPWKHQVIVVERTCYTMLATSFFDVAISFDGVGGDIAICIKVCDICIAL